MARPVIALIGMLLGRRAALALLPALIAAAPAVASGDRELGRYLAGECAACHRSDGGPGAGPAISGLPHDSFVALMDEYKAGRRPHAVMRAVAGRLSAEEIAALAAYYGSLAPGR